MTLFQLYLEVGNSGFELIPIDGFDLGFFAANEVMETVTVVGYLPNAGDDVVIQSAVSQ